MRQKQRADRRCTYVVATAGSQTRSLADYLSSLSLCGCDVIVFDASPPEVFDENARMLRWVSRHVAVRAPFDAVRTAAGLAATEKIVLARGDVRYEPSEIYDVCALLDVHEVVEPQDYLDPLPWWGGIEAGRVLVHRGVEPLPDQGATFAFRRSALRTMRGFDATDAADPVRRLAAFGAAVCSKPDLFVKRRPPDLATWLRERPRAADDDFVMPVKSAFFFAMIPMALLLLILGGLRVAAGYGGALAFASIVLAFHGRSGAAAFFPLRTCFFAPLWMLERSVSVYWALVRRVRFAAAVTTVPVMANGAQYLSGAPAPPPARAPAPH